MIRFNDDGTVTVPYKHKTLHLAGPTLSQQTDFYDMLHKVQEELAANSAARNELEAMRTYEGDPKTSTETTDEQTLTEIRDQAVQLNREASQISARLISHVVQELSDDPETAAEFAADPPVWAAQISQFTRLIYHFNNVPFDGPAKPAG